MKSYIFLAVAIGFELFGTSMLKASHGFSKWGPLIGVIIGYVVAFYFLSLAIEQIPLGIAYAIWSGVGTALTVVIGIWIWEEKLTMTAGLGILLIIAGVILLNLKSNTHG
jgi:multidrug transporter EmrE-like cation transporter